MKDDLDSEVTLEVHRPPFFLDGADWGETLEFQPHLSAPIRMRLEDSLPLKVAKRSCVVEINFSSVKNLRSWQILLFIILKKLGKLFYLISSWGLTFR